MQADTPIRTDIVLVGGGHSHVAVLKSFGMKPVPGVRLNLISPASLAPYSGMLPGYLAGHYALNDCHLDLRALCRFAGARYYQVAATGLDLGARTVLCAGRPPVAFDLLSIDIGSTPAHIEGAEVAIPVKPVDRFLERWNDVEEQIVAANGNHKLVVIGAGAGGVEAALALDFRVRQALQRAGKSDEGFGVAVVARSERPMDTHSPSTQKRMRRALERSGIAFHGGFTVEAIKSGKLFCQPALDIDFDSAVLVTPGAAAPWLRETGLPLNEGGFIEVGETLQSVGDNRVFAAGDTAGFEPRALPKSGVYAVRQGPALAENLRRLVSGRPATPYRPQRRTLALVSMGRKRAVLSYGPITAEGDWAWRFKDWIDRRWMRKYQELPVMDAGLEAEPDFDPMRCGGCGAKVPADILKRALDAIAPNPPAATVLVGLDAPDDAAVLEPPPGKALVQTVDQFRAFVEDPYLFGRITANHCLGDIYAMGADPASALATVTLPFSDDEKMEADLGQLLAGAQATFGEAGVALIGGHTGEGAELMLGFTINGFIDKKDLLRKGGLRPGDALVLTKPLGTGVLLAADMRYAAEGPWIDAAVTTMLQSNRAAAEIARRHGASAATDVTGFGLLGHLEEMAQAAKVAVGLEVDAVPVLEGAQEMFDAGIASSLQPGNERSVRKALGSAAQMPAILSDPQTAGGLLFGLPSAASVSCLAELQQAGYTEATVIGTVSKGGKGGPSITLIQDHKR